MIPSFPWIAPLAQSKVRKGSNFAIWQPCSNSIDRYPHPPDVSDVIRFDDDEYGDADSTDSREEEEEEEEEEVEGGGQKVAKWSDDPADDSEEENPRFMLRRRR